MQRNYTILIIDDDTELCQLIKQLFETNGYSAFVANNTINALDFLHYINFHAIILDYMMPKQNGIEFLHTLKQEKITIPVLMLTATNEIDNKIDALTLGAQDYLTKPFHPKELILRVNNLIKIQNSYYYSNEIIAFGNFKFNKNNNTLTYQGTPIALSSLETDILLLLVSNLNQVVTKEDMLKALNKPLNENNLNTLNVNIMRLRKKIEVNGEKILTTIRGKGFILSKE